MDLDRAHDLAHDHWGYVAAVLRTHNVAEDVIAMSEFHYITAFVHGYKHAVEDGEKKDVVPSNEGCMEDYDGYEWYADMVAPVDSPPNQPMELPEVYGGGS